MSLKNLVGEAATSSFGFVMSIFTGDWWPMWIVTIIAVVLWAMARKGGKIDRLMAEAKRERIEWEKKYGRLRHR